MNKKKYLSILSIFLLVLLFTLSGTCYASLTIGEVEQYWSQTYKYMSPGAQRNIINGVINSNAWLENKNNIPFDSYDSLIIRGLRDSSTNWYVDFIPFTNDLIFSVNASGNLTWTGSFPYLLYRFNGHNQNNVANTSYEGLISNNGTFTSNSAFRACNNPNSDYIFYVIYTNNTVNNANNLIIYGLNYTANTPVYNGTTNVENGEYYKISTGFIGSYYYDNDNYQNLEYKIISNTMEEYIGLKNIYYTPDSNGQKVDIYIYIEPSMNQKGYKVVTYYNEEVLYQENAYNTLIVNRFRFFWR